MLATTEDPVLTALRDFMEAELTQTRSRYRTRAERFRAAAADTHRDWRLNCMPPRWGDLAVMLLREGVADIVRLRLQLAYMPLFEGLERIEKRAGVLASLRREPWAHPSHAANTLT